MKKLLCMAVVAAPFLLSACSGSSDSSSPPATDQIQPSASQSAAGFIDYIRRLVAESDAGVADAKPPVDVSTFTPPTADNQESCTFTYDAQGNLASATCPST